ncbi:MAG TPA: HEAT repeat domain-containing protein, partial [Opitutaceae bacterium]|nr:HEAT repeat domain-containing protein [Opitutaceae bacterium]
DLVHGTGLRWQEACTVLGFFDDEASTAALRAALDDRDGAVRLTATRALLEKDRVFSLRQLLDQLAFPADDPPLILSEILGHLPARLHAEATEMLRAPLPAEWLRVLAISLARQQVLAAYEPIAELRRAASPRVRAAAWVALGELGDPRAGDLVGEGLRDEVADVRQAAAGCAARLGGPEVVPLLLPLLAEPDWWTGFRAARALLALGPAGRAALEVHAAAAPDAAAAQALREEKEAFHAG